MTEVRIRGVIFDLDGTLYSLRMLKFWMARSLWRSLPLLRRLTASRQAIRGTVFSDRGELLAALHAELAARAGTTIERAATWYDSEFLPAFVDVLARRAVARPCLGELLERLHGRGVRTAVVSDFGRVAERLSALRLDPALFDDLVAAEEHGVLKPSSVPLLAVARRWAIDAAEIVVVGDREDLDATAAWTAGMEFVKVGNWQEASSAIEALTELGVAT